MEPTYLPPPEPQLFYAKTVHDRIETQIEEAAKELKEGQSLLVEFPLSDGRVIIPNYIGFHNPSFIVVYGEDAKGNEVKALLSHTNLQLIITVLNKPAEKKAIGFQSREQDAKSNLAATADSAK